MCAFIVIDEIIKDSVFFQIRKSKRHDIYSFVIKKNGRIILRLPVITDPEKLKSGAYPGLVCVWEGAKDNKDSKSL